MSQVDLKEGMIVNLVKVSEKDEKVSADSTDILPITDSDGNMSKISVNNLLSPVAGGIGNAITSTMPVDGINTYNVQGGAGTYTNFLASLGTPIVFDNVNDAMTTKNWQMRKVGTYWQKYEVKYANLSNYALNGGSTKTLQQVDVQLQNISTSIGTSQTVYTDIYEPKPSTDFSWQFTGSTFSGWGFNIGNKKNWNVIDLMIRVKSGQSNLTQLKFAVKIGSKSGTLIASKTITGLNIPALTPTLVSVRFDDVIANVAGDNLYVMFLSATYLDAYVDISGSQTFPNPPYAQDTYQLNGVDNFNTFLDNTMVRNMYFKLRYAEEKVMPDAAFSNRVAQNSTTIQALIASDATALRPNASNEIKGVSVPEKQYQHSRANEVLGDSTYSNGTVTGLMMYERMSEKTVVNTIDAPFSASSDAAVTIRVYKGSSVQANPNNLTFLEEVNYAAGSFNSIATTLQRINLISTYTILQNEYLFCYAIKTAGTTLSFRRWSVQAAVFTVSGVTVSPAVGATYTNNTSTFTVSSVLITGGVGTITTNRTSGSNSPSASGTLTKASGTGDATISFSASTEAPLRRGFYFEQSLANPWNGSWTESSTPFLQSTFILSNISDTIKKNTSDIAAINASNPAFAPRLLGLSKINATVASTLDIYYDCIALGIAVGGKLSNCIFEVMSSKGKALERRWTYTPVAGDVGTTTITVNIYNQNRVLLATKAYNLVTRANTGLGSAKNIVYVSDSTGDVNVVQQLNDRFAALSGGTAPTFVGSVGSSPNKREQKGGATFSTYATAGVTIYVFNFSGGVTSVGLGATYTNNGKTFTVIEVNITAGAGYIKCTGTGAPSAGPSTLTKASGTGDATLSYSTTTVDPGNPFWNYTSSALDIANYRSNLGLGSTIDLVVFDLGINLGLFNPLTSSQIAQEMTYAKAIIAAFVADNANTKFIVNIPKLCCSTKDGFGANYGASQSKVSYLLNMWNVREAIITNFENGAYSANVEVGISGLVVDPIYGYQYTNLAAGTFYSETELSHTNAVHPSTNGYKQNGQGIFNQLLSILS